MLSEDGRARLDAGTTSVGIGTPESKAHVDVLLLDEVTDKTALWLTSNPPQIVVRREPFEAPTGIAIVDARDNSVELLFDGVQWEVKAAP